MKLEASAKRKLKYMTIRFSRELSFNASHSEQLALLLDAASTKEIVVMDSSMGAVLSPVLATRPYPISLNVFGSSIDMDAFTGSLRGRSMTFGSLAFAEYRPDIGRIFAYSHLFESLRVPRAPIALILQLLAAPVKSICFGVRPQAGESDDLGEAELVPTHIEIQHCCSATFMQSFLRRVAQSGHLESLTLSSWLNRDPAPVDVDEALFDAIQNNKQLKHFEIEHMKSIGNDRLEDLFGVLEKHEGLRTLCIHEYPTSLDPHLTWLKHLLQRNRQIEITGFSAYEWQMDHELEQICALNRFFRGSPRIIRESSSTRLSLMGAALTNSAASDVQRIGVLLTDHVDLLHEIVHTRACDGETEDGTIEAQEEDRDLPSASLATERHTGSKRKRKIASPHMKLRSSRRERKR